VDDGENRYPHAHPLVYGQLPEDVDALGEENDADHLHGVGDGQEQQDGEQHH